MPAVVGAQVTEAIVEAGGAALPELDPVGADAIAAPEVGERDVTAGVLLFEAGDLTEAHSFAEEGLALGREADDEWVIGNSTYYLGLVAFIQGDYVTTRSFLEQPRGASGRAALFSDVGHSSLSRMPAAPMPPPTHIDTSP